MDEPRQAADPGWKQLLQLGDQIARQPTPEDQCRLIEEMVGQILSAQVKTWLASPAYPLPGSPPAITLPAAEAGPLVLTAFSEWKVQAEPGDQTAALAVPLIANETLLGVIHAERFSGPIFSEQEISQCEVLAAHAAGAMEITRQEAIKNWRLEQISLVRSVSAQIATLARDSDIYDRVTRLIQETFHYYYVGIFTQTPHQGILRFRSCASQSGTNPLEPGFEIKVGEGIVGVVAESGAEVVSRDVRQDLRYRYLDVLPETLSEAALPLKVENRILGVLDFQSDRVNAFHEMDMLVLRTLADNIAISLETGQLFQSLERRAEQISTVFEVSHALTSILDLDELLNEVVRLIHSAFGYPFVHVYTVHPGRRLVIYHTGTGQRSEAMKQQARHYSLDAPLGLIPWVARNGRTFLANDVTLEPLYLPSDLPPYETRSELTVPLMLGDEVSGVLDIQSQEPNAFDENDRSLFEALAAPIAVAMRNAYLYGTEQWRRKVAESFRDVAHLVSTNLPLTELLNVILEQLENNLPCDASAIWLLDDEAAENPAGGPTLRLAAAKHVDSDQIIAALQDPAVKKMVEGALDSDHPLIRKADDPLLPLGAALHFSADYSSIVAPLRTGDRALGLLTLAHHQNGRYGSEALAITSTFASYAAVAIQNSRLYRESQEQALISTMLLQVSEASQTIMTVEDLLSTMVRLTRLLMGVKKCAFLLWEDSAQKYALKAWYGFDPSGPQPLLFSSAQPALARLVETRSAIYLDDPAAEIGFPDLQLAPGSGMIVMLPLLVRGEVIGAFLVSLQMAHGQSDGDFDPKALSILQGIAHQTSMTVDNLRLLEARQEDAYVTAALLQVAQAVVSSSDLNDTLDTIIHLLPILVGIDTCVIYLWDASSKLFRPTQVYAGNRRTEDLIQSRPYAPGEHSLLDAVRSSGLMHLCKLEDTTMPYDQWAAIASRSYEELAEDPDPPRGDWLLGYPLTLQEQVLGILLVRETNTSSAFWERRLEIIQGIAQQISLAIQNDLLKQEMVETERMEREIQLARQIQETFLPESLPEVPNWELDLRWETAREVGGDFYDIFQLSSSQIGLVIADVSDKGLPAALYMTVARTLIRAYASENKSPAAVLQEVNELLVSDSTDSMFITAVYAVLSLDTGKLTYSNAGHNLPLLYRYKTGEIEQLPKGGLALGILKDTKLEDHILRINPQDALLLYTDGVTDIQSQEGAFFGESRLHEVIRSHGKETIHNILEAIDDALIDFRRGQPPADDVTMLAVRRERTRSKKSDRSESSPIDIPQPSTGES